MLSNMDLFSLQKKLSISVPLVLVKTSWENNLRVETM